MHSEAWKRNAVRAAIRDIRGVYSIVLRGPRDDCLRSSRGAGCFLRGVGGMREGVGLARRRARLDASVKVEAS